MTIFLTYCFIDGHQHKNWRKEEKKKEGKKENQTYSYIHDFTVVGKWSAEASFHDDRANLLYLAALPYPNPLLSQLPVQQPGRSETYAASHGYRTR